ncbi:universal stress protein [Saccharopolyspora gloriosae]|uniref:Nucleotide-binding universal stress UspA family protein n=1 Tax=Saccharopolyspora gloriosae TaxID=455344 RepID=A0A840NL47_9PSEU|nr:universal stress protein [Saccharopolyspora gloriosae]MBB5070009.1 nucleotide-binding universal stress UspA family protein [Saccharopolyspora gloriosae]
MAQPEHAVVAGVDGSGHSAEAAAWATREARRRGARLHLVLVNDDPNRSAFAGKSVHAVAEQCRAQEPEVEVSEEVRTGHPIEQLLRCEETAQLMVLGSRGLGGFADALLGSVSSEVATHAAGPVVVVRGGGGDLGGPVVVGVDDAANAHAVLRFAFDAAASRGVDVLAVQAWHEQGLLAPPLPPPDQDEVQTRIENSLNAQLAEWRDRYPGLHARTRAVRGHPVPALVDAAGESPLLVVGHRGTGGFNGLFLGSVAVGVLHHARCPVAVVR